MKRIIALLTLLVAAVYQVSAMPAYPRPAEYQLPDGSAVMIRIVGDEFFSYKLTMDGYQVIGLSDGFLYYYTPGVGTRGVQAVRASDPANRSAAERRYVSSLRAGVDNQYLANGLAKAEVQRSKMKVNEIGKYAPFMNQTSKFNATSRELAQRSLVILCQFKDVKFQASSTKSAFENLLNQEGYSVNGAIGSAKDYFKDNSLGRYAPTFDVSPVVTLSENMAYYGEPTATDSDIRPREMVVEACKLANAAGVDFSKYDYNNDNYVDNVFVFYAGYNEAELGPANSIWPHRWVLNAGDDQSIVLNGKRVNDYACTSELKGASGTVLCGIGTFCHEYGHVLGLPDFYDADYKANGTTVGMYDICVMSSGGYNEGGNIPPYYTGIERNIVGWNELKDLSTAEADLTIFPIHTEQGNDVWKIETGNADEIFILESRQATRWDKTFKAQGLAIFQIDRSNNSVSGVAAKRRWTTNSLNNYLSHPCARLVESGGQTTEDGMHAQIFYPGAGNVTSFLPGSYGFNSWGGKVLPIGLAGISQSNGTVTLRVVKEFNLSTVSGVVKDNTSTPLIGARITITEVVETPSVQSFGKLGVVSGEQSKAARAAQVIYSATTDASGKYSLANVPYGKYLVMCELEGYDGHVETIDINAKATTHNVTLDRFVAKLLSKTSWASTFSNNYLTQDESMWLASKWDAADLQSVVGKKIGGVSVQTGAVTSYEVRLIVNGENKYTSKGTTLIGGNTIAYLPSSLEVMIKSGDNVRIELRVESAKSSVGLDMGPAVKGKGDLFSSNGLQWQNLSDNGVNANLMISLLYNKDSDTPDVPSVTAVPTQRQCQLSFSTTDGNIQKWNVRYKASGAGEWTEVNDIKTPMYLLTNLNPKTEYSAQLEAVFGDKKSEAKDFSFTTTDLTAKFAGIIGAKGSYKVGESYTMNCANLSKEAESIVWKWNGGNIRSEALTFAAAGKGLLDCVITYTDGTKEVLSREILVVVE